jgi:nucleotide-binding universal stress UspA family protein
MSVTPIVVAVDGSKAALHAVAWAAREAVATDARLRVVHVVQPVAAAGVGMVPPVAPVSGDVLEESGQRVLAEALDEASAVISRNQIDAALLYGPVARTLLDLSADAQLLAIGTEGAGPMTRLLLGSVTGHVAAHARCPVVVAPGKSPHDENIDVAVGIDGSNESLAALRFAMRHADRHGAAVTAVFAVHLNPMADTPEFADVAATLKRQAERFLAEAVAGCAEDYPDVKVNRVVRSDHPVAVLLAESARGELVVVGSRGRGAFTGMVLGSVSQALLRHANGVVVVVHSEGVIV